LRERTAELVEAEEQIARLAKRVEANFTTEDTHVQIAETRALVEMMEQSVEVVQVRETLLPEIKRFQERVVAAKAKLDDLRKGIKL